MVRLDVKEMRRRQLTQATITVIARRGFARTTLADIAKEARVSYGVVSFYFGSKEELLLATLHHLADEFDEFVAAAVRRAGGSARAALDAMIEADFHPTIASRKKVSVWMAYWSEARSRPAYRKLCDELDASYYRQTRDLCQRIIDEGGYDHLDAHDIAVGFNAMIDGLWLDLQLSRGRYDRAAAKRVCRAFLAAVFPNEFAGESLSAA